MSSAAARIIDLYQRYAHVWDEKRRDQLIEKAWLDRFAEMLPPGAHVLDLGCGSGEPIAGYLIRQGFALTGVDSSAAMSALCRERHPAQRWINSDMRALALGRTFDGIIAWDSFFHLTYDDQRRMFPIFRDHAAPGAPLLFTSGPAHGEAIGEFEGEPLYHASLAQEEYRSLLAVNGFDVVTLAVEDPACGKHTVWLARRHGS